MRARWLLALPLPLLLLVQACGMRQAVVNYFGGEDNAEPPAPLVEFEPSVGIKTLWRASIGDGADEHYLKLTPAVTAERIYAVSRSGEVAALDPGNGKILWEHDTDEPVSSAAGVGADLVVVGTSNGRVIALAKDTGEERWKVRVTSEVLAAPALSGGLVVVRTVDGKLTGLDAESGDRRWVYDRGVPPLSLRGNSAPVIDGSLIICGFDAGRIMALDLASGQAVWETRVAIGSGRSELERMVDIDSDPVVRNGIAYVTTFQGRVAAIGVADGRVLWEREISSHAGLAVDDANVYVTDEDGHVWALDQISGSSVWKQEALQARASSAPAVVGPYLAVGDVEGYIHWMDKTSGEFVARVQIDESPIIAAPAAIADTVYFYSSSGTLAAYTYQ